MPITDVIKDPDQLVLTVVADFAVPQQRLWDAWADPRQLRALLGPTMSATHLHAPRLQGRRSSRVLLEPAER